MQAAVIGANGQLGFDVVAGLRAAGWEVAGLDHAAIEIRDREQVRSVLAGIRPALVVNTAAFHNLDKCEDDPATAFAVNGVGAGNVARACRELDALLIHISTDYVFDGRKGAPYHEGDQTGPLNVYGISKLAGEHFVAALSPRHVILRVCGLYGHLPCRAKGENFVQTMLRLARTRGEVRVVNDQYVAPTSTEEVAGQLVALAGAGEYGVFHATAQGVCSWHEFAAEIFRLTGTTVRLLPTSTTEFASKVQRPGYSVLENRRLNALGLNRMTDWREGLRRFFTRHPM